MICLLAKEQLALSGYKLKRKLDGSVDRYKARLVAKGYAQEKGIDFDETFAPTCRMTTIQSICALAAHNG